METNNEKKALAKEALKALSEIEDSLKVEQLVKDNKIEFEVETVKYRIRKPDYAEVTKAEEAKRKKYLEFIKDDSYMFKKQWIDSYQKKGIDILDMQKRMAVARHEMETLLMRLATIEEPKSIDDLKQQITKLKDEQFATSMQITDLLAYSIEDQINVFATSFICFLVLEKQVEDKWEKVFTDYEEFKNANTIVVHKALYYISYLIYSGGDV